jgi:hypothetical protein
LPLRWIACPAHASLLAQANVPTFMGAPWSVQFTMSSEDQTRHSFIVNQVEPSSSCPV